MKGPCIKAVQGAIGRAITQGESRNIESRITDAMKRIARDDPQRWQALSAEQRLREAAQSAAKELVQEATTKKVRIAQTILAHDRVENYATSQVADKADATRLDTMDRLLVGKNDGKNNVQSVEAQVEGSHALAMSKLVEAWDAIHPKFFGLFRNKAAEDSLYLALHGETKVAPELTKAAKAFHELAESFRQRFNAAGGIVGKREDWGAPHSWSTERVLKVGKDEYVNDHVTRAKRSEYVHDDGTLYSDTDLREFFGETYDTITTDGANKPVKTSIPGGALKANRHAQERQIHFKDAQSALEMHHKYGDKNLFQILNGHVNKMARDIALIETFGPNADLAFNHFVEKFSNEAKLADRENLGSIDEKSRNLLNLYNHVAGNRELPVMRKVFGKTVGKYVPVTWGGLGQGSRDWLSAVMLGSVPISSISDYGTVASTARFNQIPAFKAFVDQLRALNPAIRSERDLARKAGLMTEYMTDATNRFAVESVGPRFTARVSNLLFRLTGQTRWDSNKRNALRLRFLDDIGGLTREHEKFADVNAEDHRMLAQAGISETDWAIWRMAEVDKWRGGDSVLTPESIMAIPDAKITAQFPDANPGLIRQKAITKLLGFAYEQSNNAIIKTSAREAAKMNAGSSAGTPMGELRRSMWLFRSFPFSYMERHLVEATNRFESAQGKIGYVATMVAMQTVLGALALEVNDLVSGRNPRSLFGGNHLLRNWLAAAAKGGGLGFYGDFLFNDTSTGGQGLVDNIVGPMGGFASDADKLTRGNLLKLLRGERTEASAEAVKFAKHYLIPGQNLWYAKAALDHLVFSQMQEYFSPGYLARAQARSHNLYGTSYWWRPGAPLSQAQEPDMSTLVKEK